MPFDFDDEDLLPAEQLTGPVVAARARVLVADFSARGGTHRFGGPLGLEVRGARARSALLHRVLTLSLTDPLLGLSMEGLNELPLVYGLRHDGCRLRYRVTSGRQIELIELTPASPAKSWPYSKYPPKFPERRFALRNDGAIEPEQVDELTWQGVERIDPADGIVAIVPPSKKYGVSLWGSGDAEQVQVVFEFDLRARTVTAYNQCG